MRDTGIGIPEDKIGRLFNKFSQVEVATTRKFGGTGPGLAITKQLAEMMGGGVGAPRRLMISNHNWLPGLRATRILENLKAPSLGHMILLLVLGSLHGELR